MAAINQPVAGLSESETIPVRSTLALTLGVGAEYKVQILNTEKYKTLYNHFFVFPLVISVLLVIVLGTTIIIPWFFQNDDGFFVRTRDLNLDWIVLYFWIGIPLQILVSIIFIIAISPRKYFGNARINKYDSVSERDMAVGRARTATLVHILYAVVMIGGLVFINLLLFIWNGDYTPSDGSGAVAIGNPFLTDAANYDYRFDQMALILSYIIGVLEVVVILIALSSRSALNALDRFPFRRERFWVRVTSDANGDDPVLQLFSTSNQFDEKRKFDAANGVITPQKTFNKDSESAFSQQQQYSGYHYESNSINSFNEDDTARQSLVRRSTAYHNHQQQQQQQQPVVINITPTTNAKGQHEDNDDDVIIQNSSNVYSSSSANKMTFL